MKKTIKLILYVASFAVLAVSCQKGIDETKPVANTKQTIEISINGLMGEYNQIDATKSELVNTVRVSWKAGDIVYVYDGTQCLGSLVASLDENEDNRYAILSTAEGHTVTAPAAGTKLTLVHSPLLSEAPELNDGAISISLADQNSQKAPFVAYATLDYDNEESIANAIVPFKFATSVIRVSCTGLKAGTAIDNAELSNVNTACKLILSGTGAPTVAGDSYGTITRTGDANFAAGKVNAEGEVVFQIAVPVLLSAEGRNLMVVQGSKLFDDTHFSQSALNAATSVNTVCQFTDSGAIPGKFSVADGKQVYFSKGNLWANTADSENPVFNFETKQNDFPDSWDTSHIGYFHWSKDASVACAKEYNDDGVYTDVFFTNTTTETAKSDFTVNGVTGKYRTLSSVEWEYLFDNHSYIWVTINEVKGYVIAPDGVTLPAGKTSYTENDLDNDHLVFLPACGEFTEDKFYGVGDVGFYWTSKSHEYFRQAYGILFSEYSVRLQEYDRGLGFSVRLVRDCK